MQEIKETYRNMSKLLTQAPEIMKETLLNEEDVKNTPRSDNTIPSEKTEYTGNNCKYDEYYEEIHRPLFYSDDIPDVKSNGYLHMNDWNDIFNISSSYLNQEDNLDIPNYFSLFQDKNY
jgi:hypothetical protein